MVKRKALLIGASGGNLTGVQHDVNGYKKYLMSDKGGAWYESEIKVLYDQPQSVIMSALKTIKNESNEIVFTVFTGHGAYSKLRNQRILDITHNDQIYESDLLNLADKQILILDSCAMHETSESEIQFSESRMILNNSMDTKPYRENYERAVLECPSQTIKLYACSENEYSTDTGKGGRYSINLIKILSENKLPRLDILSAHNKAAQIVGRISENKQNPDHDSPKLYSDKILPASIN